ncbi:uncharacterized protein STEHIDRAFT_70652 [Stereum hirsutum FP-91666 SS1]|uniref:uncharacterized protein n=1 Tax=Stereum hirsutum (strain FP-91666) TaxID=721885 RepID=UPI0004410526|nr:uncharacterized protein STEHIDRAFT_70652 [Stereum hirsutum FP-91666 SS1]EIM92134.1 hypothetical protein STEHIDRAFT_70652 [Stereum hirsutum FP-91666 SS1]
MRPSLDSAASSVPARKTTRQARGLSASEIARNTAHFDTWGNYQGCQEAGLSDMPKDMRDEVLDVFLTDGVLPASWLDESTKLFKRTQKYSPLFLEFLEDAQEASPKLFSEDVHANTESSYDLLGDLQGVFRAWNALKRLRRSKNRKVSEAEYAGNVYEIIRSIALTRSEYRPETTIALPQPLRNPRAKSDALRILNTKTVIPDGAVFLPEHTLRHLSLSAHSPYKRLKSSKQARGSGLTSFANQSTPCSQLPSTPCFEFASSFFEDKKPIHTMFGDAYRQNRMATASALRQLQCMGIRAPVLGLIWANGTVRAHVDWWEENEKENLKFLHSAPYPGTGQPEKSGSNDDLFHEWSLDRPADIIRVFLLLRNIDAWTTGRFRDLVVSGINRLTVSVVDQGHKFKPWKRAKLITVSPLADSSSVNTVATQGAENSSAEPEKVVKVKTAKLEAQTQTKSTRQLRHRKPRRSST